MKTKTKDTTTQTVHDIQKGFCVTLHKGVRITFANGWSISIQWGPGNYITDRTMAWDAPNKQDLTASIDAEIAMFDPSGNWYRPKGEGWDNDVLGCVTPDEVLRYMNMIASKAKAR